MKKLDIIYEDKEIIVINKPSHILTISDGKTSKTLYGMVREYVKKQHKSNKIFIVHRLDKDTSGVIVLAKNEEMKYYLQNNWDKITKRYYLAIVEGHLENKRGVIREYLKESKTHLVYKTTKEKGTYAETKYEVVNYNKNTTVVKIEIKTGKKNQIRVAFKNLGHPIIGDKKYGSNSNPIKRLGLHALELEIKFKDKEMKFQADIPKEFLGYVKNI